MQDFKLTKVAVDDVKVVGWRYGFKFKWLLMRHLHHNFKPTGVISNLRPFGSKEMQEQLYPPQGHFERSKLHRPAFKKRPAQ